MDDAVLVCGVEGLGNLRSDVERLREREGAVEQPLGERFASEVLHHEVGGAVVLAHIEERTDVRVGQAGDGLRFPREARAALRVGVQFRGKDLDGNRAIEAGVAGLVDLTHAARPDGGLYLIRAEAGS